jgi:hypothetical protein
VTLSAYNLVSGASAATVDLEDKEAIAPFLQHISDLVDNIVHNSHATVTPHSEGDEAST